MVRTDKEAKLSEGSGQINLQCQNGEDWNRCLRHEAARQAVCSTAYQPRHQHSQCVSTTDRTSHNWNYSASVTWHNCHEAPVTCQLSQQSCAARTSASAAHEAENHLVQTTSCDCQGEDMDDSTPTQTYATYTTGRPNKMWKKVLVRFQKAALHSEMQWFAAKWRTLKK